MSFFISKNQSFLKDTSYDNYNGFLGSVYDINSLLLPEYEIINLPVYNFQNKFYICNTSNKENINMIVSKTDNIVLWCNITEIEKQQDDLDRIKEEYKKVDCTINNSMLLFTLIHDVDWLNKLTNFNYNVSFIIKDNEYFYLYRKGDCLVYYDEQLNISTKHFNNSKILPENVMYLIDFENLKLIDLGWFYNR